MIATAAVADYCRFSQLPDMILTRFDHCFAEQESYYTHEKTCTYSCSNKVYMSDALARQNNYNHGKSYLPPDDRLMATLIAGDLPEKVGEADREFDYTRVGTIGCFCEERLLRGDGDGLPDGEEDTDPIAANLCQWRFLADSFANEKGYSVCGENFVMDVARAVAFHGENNTLIDAGYSAIRDSAAAKIQPMGEKTQNSTDTYKAFYDEMNDGANFTGHVDYAGYGEININCPDGVSICLKDSWNDLYLSEDEELRTNCSEKRTEVMADDAQKEEDHRTVVAAWLEDANQITAGPGPTTFDSPQSAFDTLYGEIVAQSEGADNGAWLAEQSPSEDDGSWSDFYHIVIEDKSTLCYTKVDADTDPDPSRTIADYVGDVSDYFCYDDEADFIAGKGSWKADVEEAYKDARGEITTAIKTKYTAEQARMVLEFQRAFSNDNSEYKRHIKSTFAAWKATDVARHLKEIDVARKNITQYYHYQFHRPEINADRLLFKISEKVTEIGGEGFTYRKDGVDDDGDGYNDLMFIDTETKFTLNVVAPQLCNLIEASRKKIADSERYFKRHYLEELNALETFVNNTIEGAEKKLLWDKNRDRLAVVEQSKATARGLSGKLRTTANGGILKIMADSAGKGAQAEGNVRLQMQGMKILAKEELTGLNLDFAEMTQDAVKELSQHLASAMIMVRKHVQDLKDELNSRQLAHETRVLLKIAQTEEISANQLKSVVDTIDSHFDNLDLEGTNSTGIDFDPNKYYMFSTVNQS